jgi:hemolysin-activating ACP:hemolysin acyltransferase
MFQSYKSGKLSLIEVFESGSDGMSFVPLAQMATKADEIQNYLPPLRTDTSPATAAYQSLGVMTLLDIDAYEGPSERKIGDVYADLLKKLQDQTAFIGLREDGRPIGYATWQSQHDGNGLKITHQSAPFGDHLKLLRTLQKRFADAGPVSAIAQRSARREQVAW